MCPRKDGVLCNCRSLALCGGDVRSIRCDSGLAPTFKGAVGYGVARTPKAAGVQDEPERGKAGEVLEFERPRRLSYTFRHVLSEEARKERPTKVLFVLEPHGKLVKLTLTHEGFEPGSKLLDGISKGWPAILASLKTMLETGTALSIPPAALAIEGFQ